MKDAEVAFDFSRPAAAVDRMCFAEFVFYDTEVTREGHDELRERHQRRDDC